MILEVDSYGVYVSKVGNRVKVKQGTEVLAEVSFDLLEGIILGKGVALSSNFLLAAGQNSVPLFFSGPSSYFLPSSSLSRPSIRLSQMKLSSNKKKKFIHKILKYKLLYQKDVAKKFGFSLTPEFNLNYSLPMKDFITSALNKEALFAKEYWHSIAKIFRGFSRIKRDPEDNLNRSLNYAYGIMKYMVLKSILATGIDPYIGIYHSTKDYRESFVFDMMEPFRPFIDYVVFNFLKYELQDYNEDFQLFKSKFAKYVIKFLNEKRFLFNNLQCNFQRLLLLQARDFALFFTEKDSFKIGKIINWEIK